MTGYGWNRRRALGAAIASTGLILGIVSVSMQSYAASSGQDAGPAGDLVVSAQPLPTRFVDLSPGESRYWSIEASLLGADRGSLALRVYGAGALIEHPQHPLTIAVEGCDGSLIGDDPRTHPICDGAAYTTVIAEQPLTEISSAPADETGDVWTLPDIVRDQARSFVVTLALPASGADDKTLMGLGGDVGVGLYSAGSDADPAEEVPVSEPDDLAATGGMLPVSLLLIGAGSLGLGLVLRRVHGPRVRSARMRAGGRQS